METQVKNPLVIRCEYCGGDQSFDIVKQRYTCAHCGAEASNAEKNAEYRHWKNLRQVSFMQESNKVKNFACPSCGAQTLASSEDVSAKCPFCQNTMIDGQFSGTEVPEVIIPFKITQEEAEKKLKDWISRNKKNPAAQVIEKEMDRFSGCYLPYHIVRGGFNGDMLIADQGGISHTYPFKAYLSHTAVNASQDWDNLFLDGIEPFDFSEAMDFDFRYLIHQQAKIQNIPPDGLANRIAEETKSELYQTLSKQVHTKEISVGLSGQENETLLAALPVYLVKCKNGIAAAVNGQTGKVSIATGKRKNLTRLWWLAPTISTLLVILGFGIFGSLGVALSVGLVFGPIVFVIAHNRHSKNIVDEILTFPKTTTSHNDTQVVFFADFGRGPVPAMLKFFTPWRIVKTILIAAAVIFLPVLLAIPIQLLRGGSILDIQIAYGAAWYCIPGFFTILGAGGLAKAMMYGSPLYFEVLPNGRTRRRRLPSQQRPTLKELLSHTKIAMTDKAGCILIGVGLFLLLGSLFAMLPGFFD